MLNKRAISQTIITIATVMLIVVLFYVVWVALNKGIQAGTTDVVLG